MHTRDEILEILRNHREELRRDYGVESIALFGSAVRNEMTETSDVDVLVEIRRPTTLFVLAGLKLRLEEILSVEKVDVVLRDNIRPELKHNILSEAVRVA